MSLKRLPPIVLDPAVARCKPLAFSCDRAATCATALVSDDGRRPLRDYTNGTFGWTPAHCIGWRDQQFYRGAATASPAPVHDTPEGLL